MGGVDTAALDEHESPGSASLHVLRGRTRLVTGGEECAVAAGQISPIPGSRHRTAQTRRAGRVTVNSFSS